VIALTTFDTDDHIFGAIKAGAGGFLLKDVDADGLHIAIRTVAAGDGVLDPAVTGRVLADLAERSARQVSRNPAAPALMAPKMWSSVSKVVRAITRTPCRSGSSAIRWPDPPERESQPARQPGRPP
jgi:DNA-binding NarL/FixJ family response regulator